MHLSACIVFTRKHVDRLCLLFVPLLFTLGYLQAYFHVMYHYWGEGFTFTLFEKLFFSGVHHSSDGVEFTLFGALFMVAQALVIFVISKNRYISLLPFVFSALYALVHMPMFSLYYAFFTSDRFSSSVTQGYGVFMEGNVQRLMEIGMICLWVH